jgi:flavin reductase (DIM6/NTAB) family NADH-FMN oxidoreductase RutF
MKPELRLITDDATELASRAEFTDAMSTLASGVVLVTCLIDDRPWGTTATSFASVSADPPTVLVSLRAESAGARAIAAARRFGVSILAQDQLHVARHASLPGAPKFLEPFVESREGRTETPVVAGALAHLDCELFRELRVADHTVFFGRVRLARGPHPGTPLLYHGRDYRALAGRAAEPSSTERSTRCLAN